MENISVCSAELQTTNESSAWLTGIVFGGCGKRGNPSCRGGGAVACPLFGARDSKEASLLCHPSRCHHIVAYGGCPGAGDIGNRRMLAVTTARGTSALDHSAVSAVCFVWELLARCRTTTHVDKGMANSFRSRSSLFTQRRGAEFLGGMSGIAGIPKGRGPYTGRTASYPGSASSTSTTDYVSPTYLTSLSSSRERRSLPACSPLESSHPFARLQPTNVPGTIW